LFDVTIGSALPAGLTEVEFLHILMAFQPLAIAVEDDTAIFHHVGIVGDFERNRGALLDQQNGDAHFITNSHQPAREILDHDRSKPKRQFIDQQQRGPAHQRGRNRHHLPLATGEQPAYALTQFRETWKKIINSIFVMPPFRASGGACNRHRKVFRYCKIGKNLFSLGHQCNTMVLGPGGYRFSDYARLGAPLSLLVILVGTALIAIVWPLHGR